MAKGYWVARGCPWLSGWVKNGLPERTIYCVWPVQCTMFNGYSISTQYSDSVLVHFHITYSETRCTRKIILTMPGGINPRVRSEVCQQDIWDISGTHLQTAHFLESSERLTWNLVVAGCMCFVLHTLSHNSQLIELLNPGRSASIVAEPASVRMAGASSKVLHHSDKNWCVWSWSYRWWCPTDSWAYASSIYAIVSSLLCPAGVLSHW